MVCTSRIIVGERLRGKKILDKLQLSNGWILIKTEDSKSQRDFRVKTIFQTQPRIRSLTPKHAHFAIDFYGKLRADHAKGLKVFQAIIEVWNREPMPAVLDKYSSQVQGVGGYDLEYILYALNWILDQEDVNFTNRPPEKQVQLDEALHQVGVTVPSGRLGSELAVSLFCNILNGQHPVEAFIKASLDVLPVKRSFGAR